MCAKLLQGSVTQSRSSEVSDTHNAGMLHGVAHLIQVVSYVQKLLAGIRNACHKVYYIK